MSEWAAKRFWTDASVVKVESGYTIHLDTRPVRTPAKSALVVPTRSLAEEIAAEWQAQEDLIKPDEMPVTCAANSAIDRVSPQFREVADLVADYGDSDLICYRADTPQELVARQNAAWDPLMEWSASALDAPLEARAGVIHAPQDPTSLQNLRALVHEFDRFELTALHELVALSGSLVIGLAACADFRGISDLWEMSRIDELWQIEQWGADEEAEIVAKRKRAAFLDAHRFYKNCRQSL